MVTWQDKRRVPAPTTPNVALLGADALVMLIDGGWRSRAPALAPTMLSFFGLFRSGRLHPAENQGL